MTTPPRVYASRRAVEYVVARPVPGAIVECGVWRGGSMMAIALTLLRLGDTDRELYLFDTFSGMTSPGDEDVKHTGESAADMLATSSRDSDDWAVASLDEVASAVLGVGYPRERIHFVQGPVEETLARAGPERDRAAPARHGLVRLDEAQPRAPLPAPRPAGVLIVDDYAYWQGARQAVDEYMDGERTVACSSTASTTPRG